MPTENLQISLSAAELQKINDALATLNTVLGPLLISLNPKEKSRLPKANDGLLPFIQKALTYAEQQPKFAPGYLDIAGLRLDLTAWQQLRSVQQLLTPLADNLNSTLMKLGSEAYVAALSYYNGVQQGAKQSVPGAQALANDLKTQFEQPTPAAKAAKPVPAV
ncbi:hypothetical protein [Hymenobacter koreensis]|uniref:Uncharacterized protein n=1 Tax=Hymenobacter koreensis TaxID=1084523 RepID=A0ABP8JM87_9BACT